MGQDLQTKKIFEATDLVQFRSSLALAKLRWTIQAFIAKVKGKDVPTGYLDSSIVTRDGRAVAVSVLPSNSAEPSFYQAVTEVLAILLALNRLVDDTPPIAGRRRFGNMACRDWHSKLEVYVRDALGKSALPVDVATELQHYLCQSFGLKLRLDYGSGHELNFLAFLGAYLEQFHAWDRVGGTEVLAVFARYYDLVRRLIVDYNLEPAGSHGVWGLDDHFHFMYILGAAQFNASEGASGNGYRFIPPVLQALGPAVVEQCAGSNLYINAVAFILRIKTGPFHEHSPMIYDIHRSVVLWSKVLLGLQKMYEVEVLGKFPVVQHFYFGKKLYLWVDDKTRAPLATSASPDPGSSQETLPGIINGIQGTKTAAQNVSLTNKPWTTSPNASQPRKDRRRP
ncbi:Phosphotyrosyl phosphatase activator [Metschnikowia bicuspidata]|uniref:Serine/threonine-protein phosphatase 2A activator n=1 Tax=Metschnikowia bicuspidata TaxID=27322 RepID=A0A4P9ZFH0_9ASCO|nr:Phosphotyrosyl phosphatase activator [Metschnikowia bicuspidata]